jgi:hypothetical protein
MGSWGSGYDAGKQTGLLLGLLFGAAIMGVIWALAELLMKGVR